ncbi:hypothetical protein F511_19001 [Dorcoceras hygrometricum]|uniref:Uncharacterized protein n=1 Tax=Dorcoceras hygrometricum TaxID=472368 RepID=A0A2Z7D9H9_9LAMI|nr:hypothetical protein F511_19001 [Dorcoceras hygrometricum]
MLSKIMTCMTAKDIWEKLTRLCEGNEQTKENKLSVATQTFDTIMMKHGETMAEFNERFNNIVIKLEAFGKEYTNRVVTLKMMKVLLTEWDVETNRFSAGRGDGPAGGAPGGFSAGRGDGPAGGAPGDVKTMAMRESKDLNKLELHELFVDLNVCKVLKQLDPRCVVMIWVEPC